MTDIGINAFAGEHFLKTDFNPGGPEEITSITNYKQVLKLMHDWINGYRLKMNDSKTKFIILGSRQQLETCQIKLIHLMVKALSQKLRDLGLSPSWHSPFPAIRNCSRENYLFNS